MVDLPDDFFELDAHYVPRLRFGSEGVSEALSDQLLYGHDEITRLIRVSNQAISAGGQSPKLSSPLDGAQAVTALVRKGDYDGAMLWACILAPKHWNHISFLKALRDLFTKRGMPEAALAMTNAVANKDQGISPQAIRRVEGRLRETSGWYPRLAGPLVRVADPVAGRVLHLVKESRPYLSNGFTSRSHQNFLAEKRAGLEPMVLTEPGFPRSVTGKESRSSELVDGIYHSRLDVGNIEYSSMPNDTFLQLFAELAYQRIQELRPSIIHVSSGRRGYETALVGLALQEKTGLPLVYEVRSFFEANWTADIEWETRGELFSRRIEAERMCMERADRVLTIGSSMKGELIARGVPAEKIGVIPNAVQVESFTVRQRSRALEDQLGIRGVPTFGYVSNMDHYRESQETLIEAASLLKRAGSKMHCILVGDGPRRAHLETLASELGVRDRVLFVGAVDHEVIPDYYGLIDIFVVPRIRERAATYVTPLKPFEAMALGRPLVVADLPALLEIAEPPLRGHSFESGNAADLVEVILRLSADHEETERLSVAGRVWVENERTWDHNGERYVREFSEVAEALKGTD
ncbi:glycosyltransferase family 4 protein [Zhihengliuella salsuginis]|uniref:D-inositol 3-phosphate glycosyltransferase n=1 Tax=Zhihengliuella salsuginis TaxID=578222 RepID=A0ABQ3GM77_9MICC|nr:glycosyltransferase family 4 protein [Zhihengliuella salsuginis]GHD11586.1 hypothetical protein GCM10008096_26150 [Zhihengliuella salsuginis]